MTLRRIRAGHLALLFVSLVVALAASAMPAHAIPPNCDQDPSLCEPEVITHSALLTVSPPSPGVIAGSGINCGSTCSKSYLWTEICDGFGTLRTCADTDVTDVVLTASGGPGGYGPDWSGCTSESGGQCTVHMNAAHTVSLAWIDKTAPTVSLSSAPSKAGPSTQFMVSASDNSGVAKVEFYVDDVLRSTDTSDPFAVTMDLSMYEDGSNHVLKAISQDFAGLRSSSLASAPTRSFKVDLSTSLSGVSTIPAYVTTAPTVAFSKPDDATVRCTTLLGAAEKGTTPSCPAPYAPQLGPTPTDGHYTVELVATDDVGNTATVTRSFTLDRGAPNLAVGAPAAGAFLGAPFTPAVTVSDGFTPDGENAVDCKIDAGEYGSCAQLAPPDGHHTLTVRAVDRAGNATSKAVALTYDATAPVVKITSGPAEGSVVYAHSASFKFATTDLTATKTTCKLDGGAYTSCSGGRDLAGLGLGIHAFVVRAVDAAGNVTEVQRRFTVSELPATGGGGGGHTAGGGGPAIPSGPQAIGARVSNFWALFGKRTRVKRLTVRHLPAGATVTVKCKGRRCPFKRAVLHPEGSKVRLAKKFKRRKLRARTVITIVVAKEGMITETLRYKIRARKFPKVKKI